jgi:hypothetical protein
MMAPVCNESENLIAAWMEGDRQPAAQAHLDQCADCRSLLGDLEAIRLASRPLSEDAEPGPHMWAALQSQLRAEGLIRDREWAECNEFEAMLARWMNGERQPAMQAHLDQCSRCGSLLTDLEAIRVASRDLAADAEPPTRLWPALLSQLRAEGLIYEGNGAVCNEFEVLIAPWMEGERSSAAQAHLHQCVACSSMLEDFQAMRVAGAGLAEDAEPSVLLWPALERELRSAGLIRGRSLWGWLREAYDAAGVALPRPELAGAYAATLALGALLVAAQIPGGAEAAWLHRTQVASASMDTQFAGVEKDTVAAFHPRNPEVSAAFSSNLAMVDHYITICEKSVREEPQDEMARDYLYGAYQQKAELLAVMAENGERTQ